MKITEMLDLGKEHTRSTWDQHADQGHLREIALNIWGEDSHGMMTSFEPSDSLLMKYENNILNCEKALRDNRVLDMGCNHGLYSYMAMRHGASHVVGVEPRGMFVKGLNAFADQNNFPMEFRRGYDVDIARLVREHSIDTVMLMSVDDITGWESMMYDIRKSNVQWLIMQVSTLPDSWLDFTKDIFDYANTGAGMPVGFTLHYEKHNTTTRSGIHPMHRDTADPDTGYQHMRPNGKLDMEQSQVIQSLRSRQYMRKFIDHVGFKVESSKVQETPIANSPNRSASSGLYQWYLLKNEK